MKKTTKKEDKERSEFVVHEKNVEIVTDVVFEAIKKLQKEHPMINHGEMILGFSAVTTLMFLLDEARGEMRDGTNGNAR